MFLVYDNYMDDIWLDKEAESFDRILTYRVQLPSGNLLADQYALKVIDHKLQLKFPLKYVQLLVDRSLEAFIENRNESIIPVFTTMLSNYSCPQQKEIYRSILETIMTEFYLEAERVKLPYFSQHWKLLGVFFGCEVFDEENWQWMRKGLLSTAGIRSIVWTLETIVDIFGEHIEKFKGDAIDITMFLEDMNFSINTLEEIEFLNKVIMTQRLTREHIGMVNRIAKATLNKAAIEHTLLLHNIILTHCEWLEDSTIVCIILRTLELIYKEQKI
jgi:hypothetical protein